MSYILVHGLGLSSNIWSRLIPLLNEEIITVDLPGHGMSDATDFSWNAMWATINNALGVGDWAKTTLILHSFSACLLPEIKSAGVRPKRIILLEGIIHPTDVTWSNEITLLDKKEFESWLIRFRSIAEIALRAQLYSHHSKKDIRIWSEAFKVVNGKALRMMATNLQKRLASDEIHDAIKSLRNSIVYYRGGRSRLSSVGRAYLENTSVVIMEISNCGHFPMIDNPMELGVTLRG